MAVQFIIYYDYFRMKMLLKYNRDLIKYYVSNIKLRTCEFGCIDEISMIDGATFDNIINRIKFVNKDRKNNIKFIIVGDCMQLPPVEKIRQAIISMVENMI